MNDAGYYDGWISFRVVITPNLVGGYDLNVIGNFGRNYQNIKEYLEETIDYAVNEEV